MECLVWSVRSSFGSLVGLLDVRLVKVDDVDVLADVFDGLGDGLPQPSPVLDELREDVEESSPHLKEFPDRVKELRHDVEESSDDLKKSSPYVKQSSQYVKQSSQRRLQPRSVRSAPRAVRNQLLDHRKQGGAYVE